MMVNLASLLFLFAAGSIAGYIYELIYNKIFNTSKNPGSLRGPYIPIYGIGLLIVYYISTLQVEFFIKLLLFAISTTGLELTVGLLFTKVHNTRLWSYSKSRLNFKGIISAFQSFLWITFSLIFYFLVFPSLNPFFIWLNRNFIMYSLLVLFYILFLKDLYKTTLTFINILKQHPKKEISFKTFVNIREKEYR